MPFARKALDASITKQVASNQPLPAYKAGYADWRAAYERKKAGIYIISAADAVDVAERTYLEGIGCNAGMNRNRGE